MGEVPLPFPFSAKRETLLGLLAVLLLGFGLRLYLLDGQSLWSDEGASVVMAGRALPDILEHAAADIHPPLYYILLRGWSLGSGRGEYALRFLSLAFGVAILALTYQVGRRLVSREVGLVGAFLAAISPFQIYYAQEARMYMPMAALAALSFVLFVAWLLPRPGESPPGKRLWLCVAYLVATLAALYTQYFAASVLVVENAAFLLLFWRFWRHWGLWLLWAATQVMLIALYVPWLWKALPSLTTWPAISEPLPLGTLLERAFLVFSFGLSWDATATAKTQLLALALLLLGLPLLAFPTWLKTPAAAPRGESVRGLVLLYLFLAIPVLTMYVLSLSRPLYNPKFLLLAAPPYALALALGVVALSRFGQKTWELLGGGRWPWLSAGTGAGLVLLSLGGLAFALSRSAAAYYSDPKYGRDDYRGLVAYLEQAKEPSDAILLNAPGQIEIFGYYYRGELPVYPLPRERPPQRDETEGELAALAQRHDRLWVVLWATRESDPEGIIESWLNGHTFRGEHRWFGSVQLVLYGTPGLASAAPQLAGGVRFGDAIELVGYALPSVQAASTQAQPANQLPLRVKPGELIPLTLYWRSAQVLSTRYTVFVHVTNSEGLLWGQHDAEPGGGTRPTPTWSPGEVIADRHGVTVALGTPPGTYDVQVGLFDPSTGRRLRAFDGEGRALGQGVSLGRIQVAELLDPALAQRLALSYPRRAELGPLRLLGYDLFKVGQEGRRPQLHAGDQVQLILYWQAVNKPAEDLSLVVEIQGTSESSRWWMPVVRLGHGYGTSRWQPGQVLRTQHRFPIVVPSGRYRLALTLLGVTFRSQLELQGIEVR